MRRLILLLLFALAPSRQLSWPRPDAFDPAFWQMLAPAGQRVLAAVTVVATAKPCELTPGYPYFGGVYEGDTNTIRLCGQAAQDNPDILRHEALHALDAVDGADCCFAKMVPTELVRRAEKLYGGWFRPGELYAMVPLVVDWDFDALPPMVAAAYAEWFIAAQ